MKDCRNSWLCVTMESSGLDGVDGHQVWVCGRASIAALATLGSRGQVRLDIWTIAGRDDES